MSDSQRKPWHRHFETVGSIVAIVVGVAALYVSWDQGRVMRDEIRASVWPALQVDGFATRDGDALAIGLILHNAGVGPARVERITVEHRGERVEDIDALLERMPEDPDLSMQTVVGRIIAAGDRAHPFELRYDGMQEVDAVEVMRSLGDAWSIEVCYCSVLDQCWVGGDSDRGQREVERCDHSEGSDF